MLKTYIPLVLISLMAIPSAAMVEKNEKLVVYTEVCDWIKTQALDPSAPWAIDQDSVEAIKIKFKGPEGDSIRELFSPRGIDPTPQTTRQSILACSGLESDRRLPSTFDELRSINQAINGDSYSNLSNLLKLQQSLDYCSIARHHLTELNLLNGVEKEEETARYCDASYHALNLLRSINLEGLDITVKRAVGNRDRRLTFSDLNANIISECSTEINSNLNAVFAPENLALCADKPETLTNSDLLRDVNKSTCQTLNTYLGPDTVVFENGVCSVYKLPTASNTVTTSEADDEENKSQELAKCPQSDISNGSPVALMLNRKCQQINGSVVTAEAKVAQVKKDSLSSEEAYRKLNAEYTARLPKYQSIEESYKNIFKESSAFVNYIEDYKNTQLNGLPDEIKADNESLVGNSASSILNRLKSREQSQTLYDSTSLKTKISTVLQGGRRFKARVQKLCGIFYCQVAKRYPMFNRDNEFPYDLACELPENENNRLCDLQASNPAPSLAILDADGKIKQTKSLYKFCEDAGFEVKTYGKLRHSWTLKQQNDCMTFKPDNSNLGSGGDASSENGGA